MTEEIKDFVSKFKEWFVSYQKYIIVLFLIILLVAGVLTPIIQAVTFTALVGAITILGLLGMIVQVLYDLHWKKKRSK